jgi:6-phosphofructokinase
MMGRRSEFIALAAAYTEAREALLFRLEATNGKNLVAEQIDALI